MTNPTSNLLTMLKAGSNDPGDHQTIQSAADEIARLRAAVKEWLCEACNTVYPGPPQPSFACVQCPKCKGVTAPRQTIELRRAERERDQALEILSMALPAPRPWPTEGVEAKLRIYRNMAIDRRGSPDETSSDEAIALASDVRGSFSAFEHAVREAIGNTNYRLIIDRAEKILASRSAEETSAPYVMSASEAASFDKALARSPRRERMGVAALVDETYVAPFSQHPDYCHAHGGHLMDSPACLLAQERERHAENGTDKP